MGPPPDESTSDRAAWLTRFLPFLALAIALCFVAFMLLATEGHFVAQNVDLYLICQYAKAMAEGHPFRYNPGEAPSTGATSLLYTVLLAVPHALGVRGEGLVAFAVLVGAALYMGAVMLGRRIGALLGGEREALLAGILLAVGGPVVWGFLYGSDIALFTFLALWLLERLLTTWASPGKARWGWLGVAVLLALARPEGIPIACVLAAAWTLGVGRQAGGTAKVLVWTPAAVGCLVLALYRWVSGYWLPTSVVDKSLFANFSIVDTLALSAEYLVDVVRGLLLGFYPSQTPVGSGRGWASLYLPPLALPLVLLSLARPPEAVRAPLRAWVLALAVLFVLASPNVFAGAQFNRYLLWAMPTVLVLASAGMGVLARLLAPGERSLQSALFRCGAGLFVALGLLSTLRFAAIYGDLAGETYRRDLAAARWITANLPRGVGIANLATSVEYLTGHRSLNLHGVTSANFFGNRTAEREAGVWEALARVRPEERPPYLLSTVSTQETLATMRELVEEPPLFRTTSLSDEIVIFRMRYDLVGRNETAYSPETWEAVKGMRLVDRLNVCDRVDEAAHQYRFRSRLGGLGLHGTALVETYRSQEPPTRVADGGRPIVGAESFRIRTDPGREVVMVLRTASGMNANVLRAQGSGAVGLEFPEAGLVVKADGQEAGRLAFRPSAGWSEVTLRLPGQAFRRDRTTLDLSGRYASFYYWFYQ